MSVCKLLLQTGLLLFSGLLLTACASSGTSSSVHHSSYYGPGWNDPMYNNHWHDSPDIIVVPPPDLKNPMLDLPLTGLCL